MGENNIKAAIFAISVVQMGANAISPILADIAAAFPQADSSSIPFLMTFPSLFVIVVSLLAASLTRHVSKKYIAAVGCGLFSLSGVLSWLFHGTLPLLFLWAAFMGVGIGLVVPMATSLVSDCFQGGEQQTVMGWQSSAANVGAMAMTFLGGLLALGQLVCSFAPNMAVVYLGCLICGWSISTVMPRVMLDMAEHSDGNPAATAALAMSASNLGGFCAPAITVGAVCAAAVAGLVILMVRRQTLGRTAKTR